MLRSSTKREWKVVMFLCCKWGCLWAVLYGEDVSFLWFDGIFRRVILGLKGLGNERSGV